MNRNTMPKKQEIDIPIGKILFGIVAVALLIICIFGSWYTVPAGHRGVLLTFGKASDDAKQEGFNWKIPIAQKAVKMTVQTQKYVAPASAASKDLQVVSTNVAVNYRIVPERVPEIYKDIGLAYEDRVIQPAVQEVIKATTAQFTAEQLITQRENVKVEIEQRLADRLAPRGIVMEELSITDFDFSQSFNNAIEQKVTAEQLKLKAERDLERIEIEAKQIEATAIGNKQAKIAQAQGNAEARLLEARAESQAINLIEQELRKSPNYIDYFEVQRWDGVMPKVTGGAMPFVQID